MKKASSYLYLKNPALDFSHRRRKRANEDHLSNFCSPCPEKEKSGFCRRDGNAADISTHMFSLLCTYFVMELQGTSVSIWVNHVYTEPNPLVTRYEENTKEIRSTLRPSILRLFLGPLVIWPKV
jgi:hypothetical protein